MALQGQFFSRTPVVLERNYFDEDIENLIRDIKKDGRVVPDRRTAEEIVLGHLPRSWSELLKATKAGLYVCRKGYLYGSESWSSTDNVCFERLTKSVKTQQIQIAALESKIEIAGDTLPLIEAVLEWARKDVRTHKAQVILNGIQHEQWAQELSFIATERFTSTRTPIGVWRFRISALFANPRGEIDLRELIPEIRIELLESAMLDDPRAPDCLCDVVRKLAESACTQVAWALSSAADEIELYCDPNAQWPMALALSFPDGFGVVAQKVFAFCTAEDHFGFRDGLADQDSDLVRIVCRSGAATDQPEAKPKSPNRKAAPKPENPGDVFLLMEFGLTAVSLRKDGIMDRSIRFERYEKFTDEYGETPDAILSSLRVNVEALRQLTEYEQVMSILQRAAAQWEWEGEELKRAVWLSGAQRPRKGQPIIRLLVDLATGMMAASIATRQESITSFLERETSAGSRLGACPKHLKVAKNLLSSHPNIEAWATQQGVQLVAPSSGADAGAKYVRLWNQVAEAAISSEYRSSWWNPEMLQYDVWQQNCMKVVAGYCQDDGQPDDDRVFRFIHVPRSLWVSDEHRSAFLSWRDRNKQR